MDPLNATAMLTNPDIHTIICCGSGGVGKTTTAAALAIRAAELGRATVVLTIDPAKRLAQSLGLEQLSNAPQRIELDAPGTLDAMMLDMRRTFDDMVVAAAGQHRAQEIFSNTFYQTISSSFSGTQEYMAMEKLGQLSATDQWDLIIVDTPPSRSALDFLDAPQRLSTALDSKLLRLLAAPVKSTGVRKLMTAGVSLFIKTLSSVLGNKLLADASTFVQALDSTFGSFRERAKHTYELLRSDGTHFLVVAAPEPDALREATYFVERLSAERLNLAGLIANRTHPVLATDLSAAKALTTAAELDQDPDAQLAAAILRLHSDRITLSARETELLKEFSKAFPEVASVCVPALSTDVHDIAALRTIGAALAD